MKTDPLGYLWSKYECFLMSGSCDIPHLRNLHVKLCRKFHVRDGLTNERTNIRTDDKTNGKAKTIYPSAYMPGV